MVEPEENIENISTDLMYDSFPATQAGHWEKKCFAFADGDTGSPVKADCVERIDDIASLTHSRSVSEAHSMRRGRRARSQISRDSSSAGSAAWSRTVNSPTVKTAVTQRLGRGLGVRTGAFAEGRHTHTHKKKRDSTKIDALHLRCYHLGLLRLSAHLEMLFELCRKPSRSC